MSKATLEGTRPEPPARFGRVAYSQSETGELLGVTRQHVARAVADGRLHAVRLGRRVLIPATEISRFLNGDDAVGGAA